MHLFCYATESGAPGLPPKAAALVRRGHCPELLQLLKARDIAVRQRSDLVLALFALVKDRRDGKAVFFRSLDGVDGILEDHSAAALRAKCSIARRKMTGSSLPCPTSLHVKIASKRFSMPQRRSAASMR